MRVRELLVLRGKTHALLFFVEITLRAAFNFVSCRRKFVTEAPSLTAKRRPLNAQKEK